MKRKNNINRIITTVCILIAITLVAVTKEPAKKIHDIHIDGTSMTVVQGYDNNGSHKKGEHVYIRCRTKREPVTYQYIFANKNQIKHLEIDKKKYDIVIIQDTAVRVYTGTVLKNY